MLPSEEASLSVTSYSLLLILETVVSPSLEVGEALKGGILQ